MAHSSTFRSNECFLRRRLIYPSTRHILLVMSTTDAWHYGWGNENWLDPGSNRWPSGPKAGAQPLSYLLTTSKSPLILPSTRLHHLHTSPTKKISIYSKYFLLFNLFIIQSIYYIFKYLLFSTIYSKNVSPF